MSRYTDKNRGFASRKFFSIMMAGFFISGVLIVLPLGTQNAKGYVTPGGGWVGDFDMLVADSMGAITGAFPMYQVHETITIMPGDTLMLNGGEDIQMDMFQGIAIEVAGTLDGNMGMGTNFHAGGAPGDWEGIRIIDGGFAMLDGVIITDAMTGIMIDNSMMTGASAMIVNCNIDNCIIAGISAIDTNSNPMINGNFISNAGAGIYLQGDNDAQIFGNQIFNNQNGGIRLMAVMNLPMIDSNSIRDNQFAGIMLEDSMAMIMNNGIYGWNATPSSFMSGGPGIRMTGNAMWTTSITGNHIMGGNGDIYGNAMNRNPFSFITRLISEKI